MVDKRRARRTFCVEPVELVAERVRLVKDALGSLPEDDRVALVLDGKAPDGDSVHAIDTVWQLVPPGHVVGGAGREDLDFGVTRQVLGHVTCMQFGAAVDRLAVALDDDGEFHWSWLVGGSIGAGSGGAESEDGASRGGWLSRGESAGASASAGGPAAADATGADSAETDP